MASRRTIKLPRAAHEQASLAQVSPLVPAPAPASQPEISQKSTDGGELTERVVFVNDEGFTVERTLRGGRLVAERLVPKGEVT